MYGAVDPAPPSCSSPALAGQRVPHPCVGTILEAPKRWWPSFVTHLIILYLVLPIQMKAGCCLPWSRNIHRVLHGLRLGWIICTISTPGLVPSTLGQNAAALHFTLTPFKSLSFIHSLSWPCRAALSPPATGLAAQVEIHFPVQVEVHPHLASICIISPLLITCLNSLMGF